MQRRLKSRLIVWLTLWRLGTLHVLSWGLYERSLVFFPFEMLSFHQILVRCALLQPSPQRPFCELAEFHMIVFAPSMIHWHSLLLYFCLRHCFSARSAFRIFVLAPQLSIHSVRLQIVGSCSAHIVAKSLAGVQGRGARGKGQDDPDTYVLPILFFVIVFLTKLSFLACLVHFDLLTSCIGFLWCQFSAATTI